MIKNKAFFIKLFFIFLLFCSESISFADINDHREEKILLICLDGATWTIMRPLINDGQLPNFSKLIENGVSGDLLSGVPYSPSAWTSIATGKTQEKHGVLNFFCANKRKARYIWSILGDFKIRTAILNWKLSLIEKGNGIMFVDPWYIKDTKRGYYPSYIENDIRRSVKIIKENFKGNLYNSPEAILLKDKNDINISMYLVNKYHPNFIAIGFTGSDIFQHLCWGALEPQYFDITKEEFNKTKNLIIDYYRKIDNFLKFFIENEFTIFFVSDHGFYRNDITSGPRIIKYRHSPYNTKHRNFTINLLLEKIGLLRFKYLKVKINNFEINEGQIDLSNSYAYFYNCVNFDIYGIRINRKLVREEEIALLRKRIYLILKNIHFENGENVFSNIKENTQIFPDDSPDVTFKLNRIFEKNIFFDEKDDLPFLLEFKFNYLIDDKGNKLSKIIIEGKEYDLKYFIGSFYSAHHHPKGVIIMKGKNLKKNKIIEGADTLDITPTILYLLGLPVAKDMDGKVLIEAIESEFVKNSPIKYIDTYETIDKKGIPDNDLPDEEISTEWLRSLGYVQ